ncbi:uncharacterized protein [Prorops nasuta]|uniref:uncharacterized protein n=1 Tax=Prorops nasuta TaxID=863751 RepID=UPI0034CF72B2
MKNLISLCIYFFLMVLCVRADLELQIDDAQIKELNKKYFDLSDTYISTNYNDDGTSSLSTNMAIIEPFPEDTMGHIYVFKFSMGEYKEPVGIDILDKICDLIDQPIIGDIIVDIGFDPDDCPPTPGTYSNEDFKLPLDEFPDTFPAGKYLIGFKMTTGDTLISEMNIKLSVL